MLERIRAFVPYIVISIVITLSSLPALQSGDKLLLNADFFQYASRHEALRKSVLEYHTLPLRSHWLGGGYPTVGDPEDPTFNPLALLTILFGTVTGLKLIVYVALLIGGLATYAFARCVLGYTRWGALFSGLVYGICPFIPLRIIDGNYNEVYATFLPLCLLLIGLACRGRKIAQVMLPFVFLTMLSDGKLGALMAIFYIGVLCLLQVLPWLRSLSPADAETPLPRMDGRPLKVFLVAVGLTVLIGMARILPARELIRSHGGIQQMLAFHPKSYQPGGIRAYTFEQLWKEAIGRENRTGFVTVGLLPVVLAGIALLAYWRNVLALGIALALFGWIVLAYNASFDLLKLLWHLPVFEAIYRPDKYLSFQIAFTLALAGGRCFSLLRQLQSRWVEGLVALVLVAFSVSFLYPKSELIQRTTYTYNPPAIEPTSTDGFFNVEGHPLPRHRSNPPRALAYINLRRNIGTIDWYTGIPIPEHAEPRYFVDASNNYTVNPDYHGEAFFLPADSTNALPATATFRPHSMTVQVDVTAPGVLVINQNYDRDWHTDHGKLFAQDGRLALQLEQPGQRTIHLRYHPRSFYAGLAVSILSLISLMAACWTYKTGRLRRWSQHTSPVLKTGSRVILRLIE